MLLKKADDKSKRLALLEDLQKSSRLDVRQKTWLQEELERVRKGIEGERETAHILDRLFRDSKNSALLHDLRLVVDGDVAQIDHLIISRLGEMILIETKNYGGSVKINSLGEFTMEYGRQKFGIPSPMEQSRRHERVLQKLLDRLGIANRVGTAIKCHHVVLFHPKAIITRPPASELDTSAVLKADQFEKWLDKFINEDTGTLSVVIGLANVRSSETVKEWGEKLIRQHRPENPLELPDFIQPKSPPTTKPIEVRAAPSAGGEDKKRLICLHCNSKISFPEGKFCWNNEARFKGGQYCREHQALF
jgi:hypothetical protein